MPMYIFITCQLSLGQFKYELNSSYTKFFIDEIRLLFSRKFLESSYIIFNIPRFTLLVT